MSERICPWYLGYFLASPLRRLMYKPETIIGPYIKKGQTILDIGSAMGFFTLPMARFVGDEGRVIAVDLQEKMIRSLRRRAEKAGLSRRIETRLCSSQTLGIDDLAGRVDFALIFAVLHEMPDIKLPLLEVYSALKQHGLLFISEPKGHVTKEKFGEEISFVEGCGFKVVYTPIIKRSYSIVVQK
ncbi:MAG: class I SAM-dependent methyltransferase [Bacteroidota bacterium]